MINSANVIGNELIADNGIHTIDRVILPQSSELESIMDTLVDDGPNYANHFIAEPLRLCRDVYCTSSELIDYLSKGKLISFTQMHRYLIIYYIRWSVHFLCTEL